MNLLYLIGCLILGMIFYHILKGFCGCNVVEGQDNHEVHKKSLVEYLIKKGHKVENPSWTNDGEKILFYKIDEQGNVELFMIDLTGYNETLIVSNP